MTSPTPEETQDIDVEKMVKKLRAPSNWLKQPRGKNWKDVSNVYDLTPFEAADALEALHHQLQKAREEERERIKTTIETLLLGVQPLPEDADTFMGEHEQTVVKASYMVKEWVMQAFEEPDHSELDKDGSSK